MVKMTNWQTKTIGELVDYEQPSKYLVKDTNYIEDGTPVLTANKAFVLGYTHETEGIYVASKDSPVIIFDDFTTDNKFVDFDFKVKSSAIKILTAKPSNALPRFVHGAMQLIKTEITEHKRRFISEYQFHPIDTPELAEQERIVGVLEVWDEYIEKLEQKIALKEQLKRGLMQQLLTGKRRLPGLSGEWQMNKLGDVLEKIEGGGTPSKEKSEYWNGSIPWASVKDIVTHNTVGTQDYITEEGLTSSSSRLIRSGTLITPTRMALGHAVFFKVDVAINQDLKALYPNDQLDKNYLFYWFQFHKKAIQRLGSGSTVAGIQLSELKSLKIHLPTKSEQKEIVNILLTSDNELEYLRQKRLKLNLQKKYLLKNLITGAISTPEDLKPLDTTRLERSAL